MLTDFRQLLGVCEAELAEREYGKRGDDLREEWGILARWMDARGYKEFSESIGFEYCDAVFGNHILTSNMSDKTRIGLRAVRMLTSYQKDGDFEFRSPSIEHIFCGGIGKAIELYLSYARNVLVLSDSTMDNKKRYLYAFYVYLDARSLTLDDLDIDTLEHFFASMNYTLANRHNSGMTLRIFLHYAFDVGITKKDLSIFVLPDDYKKHCKLPTTYEESEIRDMLKSVERSSAVGKRDYLILLLAAEYGWRSGDIVNFSFNQIDWDKNVIRFIQSKTGTPSEYPLLASVGNAIIDYTKYGRPNTVSDVVIVSAESAKKGKPLTSPTIHSIVTKYMRKANIKDWNVKKHGAHSLRHSLASNMLKKNVSMPIISAALVHQSTETTKIYLSIDKDKLRNCPLPMPEMRSAYFGLGAV